MKKKSKHPKEPIASCPEKVGISSKNGWEGVSCTISSNMDKNKRLLYILFPLSSLFPLPLPLCSSKLDHPSPSSSSQWNSSVFLQFLSFFFHSSLYFYGLLLLMRYFATKKTNIFGIRQKRPIWWYFSFCKNGQNWNFFMSSLSSIGNMMFRVLFGDEDIQTNVWENSNMSLRQRSTT